MVDEVIPETFFDTVRTLLETASTLVLTIAYLPSTLIILPLLYFVFYKLYLKFMRTSRKFKILESITRSPIYSSVPTNIAGLSTIRCFEAENRIIDTFCEDQNKNTRAAFMFLSCGRWLAIRLDLISNIIVVVISLLCIFSRDSIEINAAILGLILAYTMRLTGTLQWLVRQISETQNLMISVQRVFEYSLLPTEVSSESNSKAPESWPQEGKVEIENLNLFYNNLNDSTKSKVAALQNITLRFDAGSKIGIVGRTGAGIFYLIVGKSSFLQAFFRFVEPTPARSIKIDGLYTADICLKDLRSKLAVIPQEPFCFKGTLRFNLDPLGYYRDDEIWGALEAVQLKNSLRLDFYIKENGSNLSVGERQLICLARAILRKSKIVFMDEATSSVDSHTESIIQKIIHSTEGAFSKSTVITIAHRLETIIDYDQVVVLNDGKVVEFGPPKDLLTKDSLFFKMFTKVENSIKS
jgi:ATP-binding cassette subfamily C (CFTR/MRP) protein 4